MKQTSHRGQTDEETIRMLTHRDTNKLTDREICGDSDTERETHAEKDKQIDMEDREIDTYVQKQGVHTHR